MREREREVERALKKGTLSSYGPLETLVGIFLRPK